MIAVRALCAGLSVGLALLVFNGCSDEPASSYENGFLGDVHRELLLDSEHVQLLDGFEGFTSLVVWKEFLERFNLDRDELPLPVPNPSRLSWELDGRPGVFVAQVARYHAGSSADGDPCTLTVTGMSGGEPVPGASQTWDVLPMPTDDQRDQAQFYEGPNLAVSLKLPAGVESLLIDVATQGDSRGNYLTLLSPRVDYEPAAIGDVHVFEQDISLMPLVPEPPVELLSFAARTVMEDGLPVTVDYALPSWEVSGAFEGKTARHALALTGDTSVVISKIEIRLGDELRFGVALDRRLPETTRALVELFVGPEPTGGDDDAQLTLVGSAEVGSKHWHPVSWSLDDHVGQRQRMVITAKSLSLPSEDVVVEEPDYALRDYVSVSYRPTVTRVGLSNLSLSRTSRVPWRRAAVEQPSVLLVQIETLRGDRLTATTSTGQPLMPALSTLARLGTHYTRALAPSPWTLPSTATLLTGLTPSAHGVVHHDRMVLPEDVPTLAERARELGVATGAVFSNDLLDPHKGYARGFDDCAYVTYANARQVGHLAKGLLGNFGERQFLLLLHYFDPHHPYRAPGGWRDRFVEPALRDFDLEVVDKRMEVSMHDDAVPGPEHADLRFLEQRQQGDIAYFDEHFGRLLDDLVAQGLADTTTVIVTADHGEEFGQQGWYGHGSKLYDDCTRVPLVVAQAGEWADGWQRWRDGGTNSGTHGASAALIVDDLVSTSGLHGEVLRLLD
ncbi:MAG: hypothetical protein ACI9EF_002120, partial [Pseudohongiellaceae bacterium]